MTTTDYSRQSSGTLAGSQPVGVYSNCMFIRTMCLFKLCELCAHQMYSILHMVAFRTFIAKESP